MRRVLLIGIMLAWTLASLPAFSSISFFDDKGASWLDEVEFGVVTSGQETIKSTDPRFEITEKETKQQRRFSFRDRQSILDMEVVAERLSGRSERVSFKITNKGKADIALDRIIAFSGRRPGNGSFGKALLNGPHSWAGADKNERAVIQLSQGDVIDRSYWTLAVQSPSLAAGFLTGTHNINRFALSAESQGLRVSAWGQCDGCVLHPGASREADALFISAEDNPLAQLERFADLAAQENRVKIWQDNFATMSTWHCGWIRDKTYDYKGGLEKSVESQIPLVATNFGDRAAAGIRVVDDTSDAPYGDWKDTCKVFPNGYSRLAKIMREKDVTAGAWFTPYWAALASDVCNKHPDWLVKTDKGELYKYDAYTTATSVLDTTRPEVCRYFEEMARTWRQRGYRDVMTDFLIASVAPDERVCSDYKYHDPTLTKAEMNRRGLESLRRGFGEDTYWLAGGALLGTSMGLVDGMRISNDSFGENDAAYRFAGARWFYNRKLWLNDPDAIVCRDHSVEWNRATMSWMALSGGVMTYGDTLDDLPAEQMAIYKKVFPPMNLAGRPLDLWENDPYLLWGTSLGESDDKFTLFGVFNFTDPGAVIAKLDLDEVMARSASWDQPKTVEGQYLLWDFWGEKLYKIDDWAFKVPVPNKSCMLFSMRLDKGRPQLLSTTGHFSQGVLEVKGLKWAENKLSGRVRGNGGDATTLYFYVPKSYTIVSATLAGKAIETREKEPEVIALDVPALTKPADFSITFKGDPAPTAVRTFVTGSPATVMPAETKGS